MVLKNAKVNMDTHCKIERKIDASIFYTQSEPLVLNKICTGNCVGAGTVSYKSKQDVFLSQFITEQKAQFSEWAIARQKSQQAI